MVDEPRRKYPERRLPGDRVRAAVRRDADCREPLCQSVGPPKVVLAQLIERCTQRAEQGPTRNPVRLFGDEGKVDNLNEQRLHVVCDGKLYARKTKARGATPRPTKP